MEEILSAICNVIIEDSFKFEVTKIKVLEHSLSAYQGAEVSLQAFFGATKTTIRMDLGFGDLVDPVEQPIDLISTSRGPLFESKITLRCYPKEFIFAEKLETVVFRRGSNTRMKDFHDLYSLVYLEALSAVLSKKAVQLVFQHRKTALEKIPVLFDKETYQNLEENWTSYRKKTKAMKKSIKLPENIQEVVGVLNQWMKDNHFF